MFLVQINKSNLQKKNSQPNQNEYKGLILIINYKIEMDLMNINIANPSLTSKEREYLLEAFDSNFISSAGDFIPRFEEDFAKFVGTKYATTTSNGTTALHLLLEALNVEKKEVIVPSLTFGASAAAVFHARGKTMLVDCGADWNIDPKETIKAITKNTAGIMAVHLYGQPTAIQELKEIAEEKSIFLIEDCAEALGAEYQSRKIGSLCTAGAFSFYGNKVITTGEGGMVTTNDKELFDKMVELKNHGMKKQKKYWHDCVGYNYRMTNLQAAIGVAQLERIKEIIQKRLQIAEYYEKNLDIEKFELQKNFPNRKKIPWLYPVLLKNSEARDKLGLELGNKGIETRNFFYPLHLMPPYKQQGKFNVSEDLSSRGLLLPCHTELTTNNLKIICDEANKL